MASIAIGIGIDYNIHFLSHLKQETQYGLSIEDGIERAVLEKGKPIIINATTVGTWIFSSDFFLSCPDQKFWLAFVCHNPYDLRYESYFSACTCYDS